MIKFLFAKRKRKVRQIASGLSLVEILISLVILAFLALTINMYLVNTYAQMDYLGKQSKSNLEIEHVLQDLKGWTNRGSRIDSQSTDQKLILDTVDENNNIVRVIYQIVASGGYNILQVSYDNGATWISPYLTAASTTYQVTSGRFLYCGYQNNCTDFPTAGGAGSLIANPPVPPGDSVAPAGSTALTSPSKATKILLSQFKFTRINGKPAAIRTISDTFLKLGSPQISYEADDLQYFNRNNGSFPNINYFSYGIVYDPYQKRLLISGTTTEPKSYIYSVSRNGAILNSSSQSGPVMFDASGGWANGLALESDGNTLLGLNGSGTTVLTLFNIDLSSGVTTTVNLAALGFIKPTYYGSSYGIAYDSSTPNDFYMCGVDNTTGKMKIYERLISNGNASSASPNSWVLPSSVTTNKCGLTIDPLTGDFYLAQNNSSLNVTVYHITRTSSTTDDHFDIKLSGSSGSSTTSNIPSSTSGTNNNFQITYDPTTNHFFLLDGNIDRVFEILPPRFISPRN